MQDARVLGQRSTVTYVPNANAGRVAPSAPAVVETTLTDGERGCPIASKPCEGPYAIRCRGSRSSKARALIAPVLGASMVRQLIDRLLTILAITDIRSLRSLVQRN
jgi:hypothetical protein